MARTLQQENALRAIGAWAREGTASQQVFCVRGAAGTGKTSLLTDLVNALPGPVAYAAFTGKAAATMAAKGCGAATTLHRLLYHPIEEMDASGRRLLRFVRNPRSPAAEANLICVDEGSMVGPQLARDLRAFNKKILVFGDPNQLPPIDGEASLMRGRPDIMLTEVHRQAADNPIIALATRVREGKVLKPGRYGDSVVTGPDGVDATRILSADQVLVGTNALRQTIIRRLRQIRGAPDGEPVVGDRLVCLRNNQRKGLFNGSTWTVTSIETQRADGAFRLQVRADSENGLRPDLLRSIVVRPEFFSGTEEMLTDFERTRTDHFGFAQALSIHKAQGSQWRDVALFDDAERFGATARQLLYTALTRASERITVVMRTKFG